MSDELADVAAERDERRVAIQRAGIRRMHLPAYIRTKAGGQVQVLASIDMSVSLPHEWRGTHMSRFVRILNDWRDQRISKVEMEQILEQVRETLHAQRAEMAMRFKYFLEKRAPVSQTPCQMDYDCAFYGRLDADGYRFTLGVLVPVTTVCPCSKEISQVGAHSQRAQLGVRVRTTNNVILWIEDLVPLLEQQGSCQIFPLLRREDEKWVTERSFRNPKFVEDVVRDTVAALRELPDVTGFRVECEALESIHNHNVYACADFGEAGSTEVAEVSRVEESRR